MLRGRWGIFWNFKDEEVLADMCLAAYAFFPFREHTTLIAQNNKVMMLPTALPISHLQPLTLFHWANNFHVTS